MEKLFKHRPIEVKAQLFDPENGHTIEGVITDPSDVERINAIPGAHLGHQREINLRCGLINLCTRTQETTNATGPGKKIRYHRPEFISAGEWLLTFPDDSQRIVRENELHAEFETAEFEGEDKFILETRRDLLETVGTWFDSMITDSPRVDDGDDDEIKISAGIAGWDDRNRRLVSLHVKQSKTRMS